MPSNYVLLGPRWGTGAMGTSGGTVTWSVDGTVDASWIKPISQAFADWSQYANISFAQVQGNGSIQFKAGRIDGPGGTLGETGTMSMGNQMANAIITVDSAENYHLVNGKLVDTQVAKTSGSFDAMISHEIGHALGLGHESASSALALMNPTINTDVVPGLMKSDIDGIQALYGARPGAPVTPGDQAVKPVAPTQVAGGQADAVFRFYDTKSGDHFYTSSSAEKQSIQASLPNFNYEGVAWGTPHKAADTVDVFRFWDDKSGSHFFTTNAAERDSIIKNLPTYHYEGVAFQAFDREGAPGSLTLDRFFNAKSGAHHFSAGAEETAWIKAGNAGEGWIYEGHGFTVAAPSDYLLHA